MRTALITGASSGIGRELAVCFARDGINLVLVARNESKLQELADQLQTQYKIQAKVMPKNLEDMGSVQALYLELKTAGFHIDYLVNNAGFGVYGNFLETDLDQELRMIDLNVKSLTYLTKLFVPEMVKQGKGGVLNVASTAAFQPGPLMAVYYATKAYVLSFTEALENELRGTGVNVTALCPGPTLTGFGDRANLGNSRLFQLGVMDAKTVAEIGYAGFRNGKRIVIPGLKNRLLANSVRFAPRKLVTNIVRYIQGSRS
jgi:uncharacterized protein